MSGADWPFDDPPNVATVTTLQVMSGEAFVDYVSHDDDDGGWQFLSHGAGGFDLENALLVSLGNVVSTDPTLNELADLPFGWCAVRQARDQPWVRAKQEGLDQ